MSMKIWHKAREEHGMMVIVAVLITLFFNLGFFSSVTELLHRAEHNALMFHFSIAVSVFLWILFYMLLLSLFVSTRVVAVVFLVLSAVIAFVQNEYRVIFDETMIRNLVETDIHEASDLISLRWVAFVLLAGVVPAVLVWRQTSLQPGLLYRIRRKLGYLSLLLVVFTANVYAFSGDYASLLRNNRYIRDEIVPTGFLYSTYKYAKESLPAMHRDFVKVGQDAQFVTTSGLAEKKMLFVVVVGETARAANFGLSGYTRNTTPLLAQRIANKDNLYYFDDFYSCGTSTTISVPCMFSAENQNTFDVDDEKSQENLLDLLTHAGLRVVWIDNNSGCKGVCDRVETIKVSDMPALKNCDKDGCFDEALVQAMDKALDEKVAENTVIVLHQQGSHGPAYYERAPQAFHQFQPTCHSNNLPDCTHNEIVNSYDNSILYTDYVLNGIIDHLQQLSSRYATAMLYASDHGESLGEHGLYLHGMPYSISPDEQRHVPALLWFSDAYQQAFAIAPEQLQQQVSQRHSHDNIFHTLLGAMQVKTVAYQPRWDMVHGHQRI